MIRLYGKGLTVSQCSLCHPMTTLLCVCTRSQQEYLTALFSKSSLQSGIIPGHNIGLYTLIKTFEMIDGSSLLWGIVLHTCLLYCLGDSRISTYQICARYWDHDTCRLP